MRAVAFLFLFMGRAAGTDSPDAAALVQGLAHTVANGAAAVAAAAKKHGGGKGNGGPMTSSTTVAADGTRTITYSGASVGAVPDPDDKGVVLDPFSGKVYDANGNTETTGIVLPTNIEVTVPPIMVYGPLVVTILIGLCCIGLCCMCMKRSSSSRSSLSKDDRTKMMQVFDEKGKSESTCHV